MKSSYGSFKFHVITKPGLAGCAVLVWPGRLNSPPSLPSSGPAHILNKDLWPVAQAECTVPVQYSYLIDCNAHIPR